MNGQNVNTQSYVDEILFWNLFVDSKFELRATFVLNATILDVHIFSRIENLLGLESVEMLKYVGNDQIP